MQQEIAQLRVEASTAAACHHRHGWTQERAGRQDRPEVAGDVEMLQDMVLAACNEAAKSRSGEPGEGEGIG